MVCSSSLDLIRNGACNDETNNLGCEFDGGDCCGSCVNKDNCVECICHNESESASELSCKVSIIFQFFFRCTL